MKEFEVRSREMLTTGEWCNSASKISLHIKKVVEWGLGTRGLLLSKGDSCCLQ